VRGVALPRGTLTFLFSDIEGSTRLLAGDEAAYARARSEHLRILRDALAAHEGVEVDTAGDGLFAVFASARSAVAAVEQSQAGFAGFRVRMGLHSGEATPTTSGYVGMDVHRAARIAAAAQGGQIVLSETTRALLADDERLLDLGEHRLKDLEQSLRLYQLGDGAFPPLATLGRTNLPVPHTRFLGRQRELSEVGALLDRDDVRLVTLTGPGGSGKTRLALQVAGEQTERYPDGVWLVSLAPLSDWREVMPTLSSVLGVHGDINVALADRRTLLVFDNFEHLLDAGPQVSDLLDACPGVDALATSRLPLRLDGEWAYDVPPLRRAEAAALLAERAAAIDRTLDVAGVADEVCAQLDDLPLAIELAAARLRALTPEMLLMRLDDVLALLTRGARDAPSRQQTLRATIAWSVDLLGTDERVMLARLAIFAGGFTLEAAEAVCDATLDTLDALVEHSLIRQRGGRFSMLRTIREYACEMLAASGERDTVASRHIAWFANLADTNQDVVTWGAGTPQALAAAMTSLRADQHNLSAAIEEALRVGNRLAAARITATTFIVWEFTGAADLTRRVCQRVLDEAQAEDRGESLATVAFAAYKFGEMLDGPRATRSLAERWVDMEREGSLAWQVARAELHEVDDDFAAAARCRQEVAWRSEPPESARVAWMQGCAQFNLMATELQAGDAEQAVRIAERSLAWPEHLDLFSRLIISELLARALIRLAQPERARGVLASIMDDRTAIDSAVMSYRTLWAAALAWEREDPRRAAIILAAAETAESAAGLAGGRDLWYVDGDIASVRARLGARIGEEEYADAWRAGTSLSVADAFDLARAPRRREAHDAYDLTPREQEVLLLICEGCSNQQIADRLFISPHTVAIHVSRVLAKMDVSSRTQAAAKAHAERLVEQAAPAS
jgi:predicted ATPase/class 3 adenylate cyclase/DNA-binding CsgD family transcriptional regulator